MTRGDASSPGAVSRHRHVRLVVGPPGPTGIQESLVEEVRRLKSGDALRPVTVLVGSNYLKMHLSRHLAIKLGGHAAIRFAVLKDLARDLGTGPLVDKGRRALPEFGRDLLLRESIAVHTHGTYFRDIAWRDGFLDALDATLRDLKEASLDPVMLRAAAGTRRKGGHREAGDDVSAGKLEDLADLFEAYDDLLRERRFYDDEDLMRSAASQAASVGASSREDRTDAVLVYGFYDATWVQRQLIQEYLAFRTGIVFFPFESNDVEGSYDYARPMLSWLASWIPERIDLPAHGARHAPDVSFLSAPGEVREALEATRWLLSRARDRSLPFGEMGLIYRSPEPYGSLVPAVISQVGEVPRFLSKGRPLSTTPAARALQLLLLVREEGFARRSVVELLSLTAREGTAPAWDRVSREAGVVRGIADWRRKLGGVQSRPPVSRPARELLARVEELHAAVGALPEAARWRDLAEICIDLVNVFAPVDPSIAQVESRLASLGALDEISSPVELNQFTRLLKRALEETPTHDEGEGDFQRSGIFVGDIMDARLLSFDALAVVGLVERSFPLIPRQDPILLDEERESINRIVGAGRLPLKGHRADEERLLFRLVCASAVESLLLSYPRLDPATARSRIPSSFLLRTARELEGRVVDYEALERLPRTQRVGLGALSPRDLRTAILSREFDLCALGAASTEAGARRRVASFLHANPILHRALEAEEARWGEPRFTAFDGVILRPNVLESLRGVHPVRDTSVSASGIEAYAACPLAYFMERVLDLEALEEPEECERLDPRRRGNLVHRILFELFTALRDRGELPITERTEASALSVLHQVAARRFAEEEQTGMTGHPMLWSLDREQILDDLAKVIAAEAAGSGTTSGATRWLPAHFEIRYGMEARRGACEDPASTNEPVVFEIGPGRALQLKGRIDRIEISEAGLYARVTDYKTGRMTDYRDDVLAGGTAVQLPLYMLAAEKLLSVSRPGLRAREARYLSVDRKGGFKSVVFGAEALSARREGLAQILSTFVNGVARGVFFAYPEPEMCRFCDYRLACGEGREQRFARKRADATAADYLRMREGVA